MSKIAISAKLDETLLQATDVLAKRLKIARNRAVEEGLKMWIRVQSRALLATEMKKASLATRKESGAMNKDWDETAADGLDEKR